MSLTPGDRRLDAVSRDGALRSPTVGTWRPRIDPGAMISGGEVLGWILRARRWIAVTAPRGARGQARDVAPAGAALEYGAPLAELGAAITSAEAPDAAEPAAEETSGRGAPLRAPMSGVIYLRPSPSDPPFAATGDTISPDETLALLEVMKTFTPVRSGTPGILDSWAIRDGDAIESGQVIAWIQAI